LVAERGDGSVAGVLPLTEIRSPIFGAALVSAGFGTDGGILAEAPGAIAALASGAWSLAENLNIGSVELRGGPVPDDDWTVSDGTYVNFVRDLAADDDAELARIPRNRRAVIRKAMKQGMTVEAGRTGRDAAAHYACYAESVRNLGTPVFPRALFAEVLAAFGEEADVLTVRKDGIPVASVLSLYLHGTVYPYWGGGTTAGRDLLASDLMYFALMGHARARGCTRYDFGRSKIGTGAAAYKSYWGFEGQPLSYATRTRPGEAPRVVNPMNPKYRLQVAAWKRLPLWAANLIGPHLSRGLG
jgi:FemAB-related protein (PEP-CTERM system-associated)